MARNAAPKTPPGFRPFADEATVESFGAFSIENGASRIALHGALELTRNRAGLDRARRLKAILDGIVVTLEARDLPERVAEDLRAPTTIENPFA